MEMKNLILKTIKKKGRVATADIARIAGCSRQYGQRFLKSLVDEGAIVLVGKSNQAHYILPRSNFL